MSSGPTSRGASSNGKPNTRDAFAQADSDFEAAFQEVVKLESQGGLDAAARARLNERMHTISKKLKSDLAAQIAQINSEDVRPKRWVTPKPFQLFYIAALIVVIGGALLETTVGRGFIFSGSTPYRSAMPWLFGALIPILALAWFLIERVTHHLQTSYRYWSDRIFMFSGVVALTSALVVVSPLGWAALLGKTIGSPSRVEVNIISVDEPSRRRYGYYCVQQARLEFDGAAADICLDGRLIGSVPSIGEKMAVVGRVSRLGLYIDRLENQRASQ